jgi:hypothetical protein
VLLRLLLRAEAALAPNPLRDLKVKVSVAVRMDKEVTFYQQEAVENEAIVQKLEAAGKDAYDMKQAKECLQESYMMIPDSKNRHQKALEDLHGFLDENATDPSVAGTPSLADAIALLLEHGMPFEALPEAEAAAGQEFAEGEIF